MTDIRVHGFRDLILPVAVVGILASMIVPVPAAVMDYLLVGNLVLALVLLISALYISEPLKLSALPTMLLLATLYRLALNISTTRLVLGAGDAGAVVEAFGHIVIQGNLIVGFVIFLVITLVQFLVIAKGAERVAEVAARFTLDALPGRQMSIDADVRAGLIDFTAAREKRQELQTESRFYGALDGAMKFIKGDAIAGIVVTAINIIGGLMVGILVQGMDIGQAATKYTVLTIGDGLVSQIPALLNALAAGLIVTRVSRGDGASLTRELMGQIGQVNRVKVIIGAVAIILAMVPGMPFLPFALVALALFIGAALTSIATKASEPTESRVTFSPALPAVLEIRISERVRKGLTQEAFSDEMERFRQNAFNRHGLILLTPTLTLGTDVAGFQLLMRGVVVAQEPEQEGQVAWAVMMRTQLEAMVANYPAEFVDDVLTRRTLDTFDKNFPELIAAVVPTMVSVTQITEILRGLTRERVSLRNFDLILQAIAEFGSKAVGERALLREVRVALKRTISAELAGNGSSVLSVTLHPILDLAFAQAERDGVPVPQEYIESLIIQAEQLPRDRGLVFVVSKGARALVRDALLLRGLDYPTIAFEELAPNLILETQAEISIPAEREKEYLERLAA